jgi:hypothetical protein
LRRLAVVGGPSAVRGWRCRFDAAQQLDELRLDAEVGPLLALLGFQQPGAAEDLHVAGDGGLRHPEDIRQLADAERIAGNEPGDAPTDRIAQGAASFDGIHRDGSSRNGGFRYGKGK